MTARIFNLDEDERFVRASSDHSSDDAERGDGPGGEIEILTRATGFSGAISLPLLPDLIQIYTTSMASGALTIRRGTQSGTIWFDRGAMVHAVCGTVTGEEAVYRLLEWHDGQFTLDGGGVAPSTSITASWQEVLMEGCRRLDEAAAAAGYVQTAAGGRPRPWQELLSQIEQELGGLLAVAILDSTDGSLIAQRPAGGTIDLAGAGPLIAQMLRHQAMLMTSLGSPSSSLDSLSILGDQIHLLEALPEGRLLYLAVLRNGVSLAVIRRVVDRALGNVS
jgi:hypothetical protein